VWIRFARAKDIRPLTERFVLYNISPYANNYLLTEIFDAMVENKWANTKTAAGIIDFIGRICEVSAESVVYKLSPDFKDNYLFDLAIQNNCELIISDDSVLLDFLLKPVPVKSTNWFLKHFPVF
jgi:hypothetical protein